MENTGYYANLERTILSSILFDPSNFENILDDLQPKDFAYPAHRNIFEVCVSLHKQKNPLDEDFVRNRVDKRLVSDEEFVKILATNPIANIEAYIKELKNISLKRELHSLANTLREQSLNEELDSAEILNVVEKKIFEISTNSAQSDFRNVKDILDSTVDRILEHKQRGNSIITGVTTGFLELDEVTTGFNKGDLIIIGARPSMGKTTLFLNMAQHILNRNIGVAVFSLEMPAEQLMLRMISALSSLPLQKLKIGNLDDGQIDILTRYADQLAQRELFIDDGGSLNIHQLRSKLRKLKSQNPNIGIAIVDYLQLMRGVDKENRDRHLEVSEISRGLKILARELQIPIIALSQLNRTLEARDDKRPILSDLRESGSIEQDADIILFLYREEIYHIRELRSKIERLRRDLQEKGQKNDEALKRALQEFQKLQNAEVSDAEILVAKNRNGETRDIKIQFSKRFTRFENRAKGMEEHEYQATKNLDDERLGEELALPGNLG
ncbi:replicative DNA helicase [Helicobacter mustelae]|uniref:Replicative DNA helicase n=1 Tax=Helicobacter mustelae (strain ATCC 43772 / CCUG 25715 / CIP 103759 / LMG 18044 / NCTC 12198 / R85-136P) TaxID=679897 RepID=D3UJ10_HELM1|nr:replicative DNA helicase [Helicobacter mustelae]CBG40485.1 replicative DNA helicase [Helicobacter mustelae 12198]SQH71984.1 replicative DNA helicase [Helicobacter mustelae]STP13127.1 replicative DNA helicase [Helicobacter mustelae]